MSAAVGAELREEDLLKVAKCGLCGKGIGHTGLPLFWRVTVARYGIDVNAVRRQDGLAQHIGSSMLARVMGPDEVMAKPIGEAVTSTVCETCAVARQIPVALLAESEEPVSG